MEFDGEGPGFVSGFVSLLGRPNVGKSTLLNTLLGAKVAIVSDKPQTTRVSIQGILNLPAAQIVFVDTPGIHRPDTPLNRRMMRDVSEALEGRDLLAFMADCTKSFGAEDERALQILEGVRAPVLLLLNKVDALKDKARLLPLIEKYRQRREFAEFIPVSALNGDGLEILKRSIVARLPPGPPLFPGDEITDQPERFFVAEIVREKVLRETRQEVPHSVMVQIDEWRESSRLLRVSATILVEKTGQKAIVIGARASMLKRIGTLAREELEQLLGRKIYLELFVKVRKKWREQPAYLRETDWKG